MSRQLTSKEQEQRNNWLQSLLANSPEFLSVADLSLLRDTIAKDLTPSEFRLFLGIAKVHKLDPIKKEIYAVKYGSYPASYVTSYNIIVQRAHASGKLNGIEGPFFCSKEDPENWKKLWVDDEIDPYACRYLIHVKDFSVPIEVICKFSQYVGLKKNGEKTQFWQKRPDFMLAKCTLAHGLRLATPKLIEGLYIDTEMEQMGNPQQVNENQNKQLQGQTIEAEAEVVNDEPEHGEDISDEVFEELYPESRKQVELYEETDSQKRKFAELAKAWGITNRSTLKNLSSKFVGRPAQDLAEYVKLSAKAMKR